MRATRGTPVTGCIASYDIIFVCHTKVLRVERVGYARVNAFDSSVTLSPSSFEEMLILIA